MNSTCLTPWSCPWPKRKESHGIWQSKWVSACASASVPQILCSTPPTQGGLLWRYIHIYIYFMEIVQLGPCHSGSGTGTENIVAQLYFSWIGHIPDILFQIQNFSQVTCCIGREFFTSAKVNYCNLGSTAWTVAMP